LFESSVEIPFSAAHQIRGHPGQCARLHGHNYRAIVTIAGGQLDALGMVIDFGELKQLCAQVIGTLDHCYLNEVPAFAEVNPTAEAIARHVYRAVASALTQKSDIRLAVARVTIYESDRSYATYWE
jgi:6-pyruvoyltetrahydropterin/6-carboxytetrahydropterin synthase